MMLPTACTEMVLPDPWLLVNVEWLPYMDERESGDGESTKTTLNSRSWYIHRAERQSRLVSFMGPTPPPVAKSQRTLFVLCGRENPIQNMHCDTYFPMMPSVLELMKIADPRVPVLLLNRAYLKEKSHISNTVVWWIEVEGLGREREQQEVRINLVRYYESIFYLLGHLEFAQNIQSNRPTISICRIVLEYRVAGSYDDMIESCSCTNEFFKREGLDLNTVVSHVQ